MEKKRQFGELELAILQGCKKNEWVTVRQILEMLGGQDKYTTVMTVMNRMAEKSLLTRVRKGHQYHYTTNQLPKSPKPHFLNRLKEKIFGGRSAPMVSYLLETGDDITEDDLEAMESLIQKMRSAKRGA